MSRTSCFDADLAMQGLLLFVPALSCLCGEVVVELRAACNVGRGLCGIVVGLAFIGGHPAVLLTVLLSPARQVYPVASPTHNE